MEVQVMSVLSSLAASYESSFSDSSGSSSDGAAALVMFGFLFVVIIVVYLITAFLLYKVFQKAGRPGWAGFVPVYNGWVLFEISGKPGWWVLFGLIPYVGSVIILVLGLLASLELAKRFGKSQVFAIFGLWLFSLFGYAILAFDSSKYQGAGAPAAASPGNPNKTPEIIANNNPQKNPADQKPPTPPNFIQ